MLLLIEVSQATWRYVNDGKMLNAIGTIVSCGTWTLRMNGLCPTMTDDACRSEQWQHSANRLPVIVGII